MTNTEKNRIKAICEVANIKDIGELSDGFHTFNALYEQRMILFAALVKAYKDKAWKSYRHEDGEYCFGRGWFIVGIDTPEGSYTYHYENKYWDMFDCVDLPRGKHWDGHTEADAETRLMSLEPERKTEEWIPCSKKLPEKIEKDYWVCLDDDHHGWQRPCKWRKYPSRRGDFWTWHVNARVVAWMPLPEPYREGEQE